MSDQARRSAWLLGLSAAWIVLYGLRAVLGHLSLQTNAYDLSVFEYALWSSLNGHFTYVPFIGEPLSAQHVMPTLALMLPVYFFWQSSWLLILVQLLAFASAAFLLHALTPKTVPPLLSTALLVAFLFGRRSHSAATSYFYIESLEPFLVLFILWCLQRGRYYMALAAGLVALGCKEDTAIYFALYGLVELVFGARRIGFVIAAISATWLIVSLAFVLPRARVAAGLPAANPFLTSVSDRSPDGADLRHRVFSHESVKSVLTVTSSVGFLCWLDPSIMFVTLPGLLASIVGNPHTSSIGLTGHYLFPVLPWLFYAAARGSGRLSHRPRIAQVVAIILLLGTCADSPSWQGWPQLFRAYTRTRAVRSSMQIIPDDASLLVMPNLLPHVGKRNHVWTVGSAQSQSARYDYVALTLEGDLWPVDVPRVRMLIANYDASPDFDALSRGPAFIYRRRAR